MEKTLTGRWVKELPAGITVCDNEGNVIEMNDVSADAYAKDGGYDLIGRNIRDCHPPEARKILDPLLDNGTPYFYTIEKNGVKKMLCEIPWYKDGKFGGLVELSLVLPEYIPHYQRSS